MNNNNFGMNNNMNMGMNMYNNMLMNNMNMNIDPLTYQFMFNMMLMLNPNLNVNNQINLNNMMMNFMNANPYLYQMYNNNNNINNNINNNNNMISLNTKSNDIQNASKNGGILRNISESSYDPFIGNTNKRIPILFRTGVGIKIMMNVPINVTVHDLLIAFIHKVNLDESVLGKMIYFLYNGNKIKLDEKKNIIDYGFVESSNVLVVDASNLIGGDYIKNNFLIKK